MKIICKGRQEGKTTELIEFAKDLPGNNIIVCHTLYEVEVLWKYIKDNNIFLSKPITFQEFINEEFRGRDINSFLIDDADMFLQSFCRDIKIRAVAFNKDNLWSNEDERADEEIEYINYNEFLDEEIEYNKIRGKNESKWYFRIFKKAS